MKKILRSALLGTAVGTTLLSACDATAPRNAPVSQPVESTAIPPSETLVDVVRKSLADIVRDKDAYSRARRLGTLIPSLGKDVVPAVQQTLDDPLLDMRSPEVELLVRFWATHQPEAALTWAKEKAPLSFHDSAVFSAITAWAEKDPQAASSFVWPLLEDPSLEATVPGALVRGWFAANDPPELQNFLSGLPPGIPQQRAIVAYATALAQARGLEAVQRWAESLPDKNRDYKLAVFRRSAGLLARLDVEAAVRWCNTQCDGPYGGNLRTLIGRQWVMRDGPATMKWLSTQPAGFERNLAQQVSFGDWARADRAAALAWMAAQTTGEPAAWLRPIYPMYARYLSGDNPAEAIKWAERTEDPQDREIVMIGVARVWRYLDEAAAEAWLAQSSLSEEARAKVRAPVKEELPQAGLPQVEPPQPAQPQPNG